MLDLLSQGWVGTMIGLLGLVVGTVGLVLYMKSKIGPRPACQMRSIRLISKEKQELPSDVKILFQNTDVPRLTLTKIWFWNYGTETIRGNQVVEDDPLRCAFDATDRILTIHVAAVTRPVNKFSAIIRSNRKNEALLFFDFLDPNDGARIEILHTSKQKYPGVIGTIRGIPKGIKNVTATTSYTFDRTITRVLRRRNLIYSIALTVGLATLFLGMLPNSWLVAIRDTLKAHKTPSDGLRVFRFAMLTVGVLYTLMPLTTILSRRRKYPMVLDSEADKDNTEESNRYKIK